MSKENLSEQPSRLGIALSGGAARGFAHIGVLRAFEENGIEFDRISGSSSGALIGLLYASGKTPDDMLDVAKSIKKSKLKAIKPFHFGTAGLDYVEQLVAKHITQRRFEELRKPLFVCATNFQTGNYKIFSSGELIPAIRASAAIPIKFGEQIIDGVVYIDGGMVNNLPVEPLRDCCQTVIGVSINPVAYKAGAMSIRQKIMRLTELLINANEYRRIGLCDYHIEIAGLGEIGFEEYDRALDIHDLGYKATKNFISEHPQLLNQYELLKSH